MADFKLDGEGTEVPEVHVKPEQQKLFTAPESLKGQLSLVPVWASTHEKCDTCGEDAPHSPCRCERGC